VAADAAPRAREVEVDVARRRRRRARLEAAEVLDEPGGGAVGGHARPDAELREHDRRRRARPLGHRPRQRELALGPPRDPALERLLAPREPLLAVGDRGQPLVGHVLDVRAARAQRGDQAGVDVDTDQLAARLGERHGQREADITQPHDPDLHLLCSSKRAICSSVTARGSRPARTAACHSRVAASPVSRFHTGRQDSLLRAFDESTRRAATSRA
jgi:hypothetical protein